MMIRDPESGTEKIGSEMLIPDPHHCILVYISESLLTSCGLKRIEFFASSVLRIRINHPVPL